MNIDDIYNELMRLYEEIQIIYNEQDTRYKESPVITKAFKSILHNIERCMSECQSLHKVLSMPKNTRFYCWDEETKKFRKLKQGDVFKHAMELGDLS